MITPLGDAVPDGPRLVVTTPVSGGSIRAGAVDAAYTTTGSLAEVHHAQFRIDGGDVSEDLSFDGVHQLAGVQVGAHTLNGWLVRADHSKIPGSDTRPVSFVTTAPTRAFNNDETTSPSVEVTAASAVAADPSVVGQWAGPYAWPLVTVHTTLMPNGKVLLHDDHTNSAGVQVWDPVTENLTSKPYNSANLFCSGHTVLVDGRVFVVGGHSSTYVGIPNSTFFNPRIRSGAQGPS
jgi:hypothetical protein